MATETEPLREPVVVEKPPAPPRVRVVPLWRELVLVVVGYLVYAQVRTLHGHALDATDARIANRHGLSILHLEQALGLDWERGIQQAFLPYHWFIKLVGGFYGGAHFVVTIGALVWLLLRRPGHYRFWRTVLFVSTILSVAIFALFPAAPPRVLPPDVGTVDTLDAIGGLWSYNHGVLEHISDPFAPMPSLHLGWATWVAAMLWTALPAKTWRSKIVILAYPAAVYFGVIVTGTHYVIDGVAGIAMTLSVVVLVRWVTRWRAAKRPVEEALLQLPDETHGTHERMTA